MGVGKRGFVFVIATGVCLAAPLSSCLDATEIVLQLSTDVKCDTVEQTKVLIRIGAPGNIGDNPPTHLESIACTPADATASASNDLGSMVVLPSSGFDSIVSISIALSDDTSTLTSTCYPEDKGGPSCIYAHRQISFLPHARVTLPIVLSSVCAGVSCAAPLTCDPSTGKCGDGTVDPHDCGTSCSTEDGGGPPDAIVTKDVSVDAVHDSPISPDGPVTCSGGLVYCNGQCIDVQSSPTNCGGCGLDCTGGSCVSGTCRLDTNNADSSTATVNGTCLAVFSGYVWVSTTTGVMKLPTNGGVPIAASTVKAFTLASYANDLAWIEGTSTNIHDWVSGTDYAQGVSGIPEFMAVSPSGYVWSDYSKSNVWVQLAGGGSPTSYFQFQQGQYVPVAMSKGNVYWTVPTGTVYWKSTTNQAGNAILGSQTDAVIVDDPTSTTPHVFVVAKANQIMQLDYKLATATSVATSALVQLGALAYDGVNVFANGVTEIQKNKGLSMSTVTTTTNTVARCLAVDDKAVYWLEQGGGVYKHAK